MSNDLTKHKKSDKVKWIIIFAAVLMLAVSVTAAMTKGFKDWNPYGWFDKKDQAETGNNVQSNKLMSTPADNTIENSDFSILLSSASGFSVPTISVSVPVSGVIYNGVSNIEVDFRSLSMALTEINDNSFMSLMFPVRNLIMVLEILRF